MGCLGVHFAITSAQAEELLEADGDEELGELVAEIEAAWDEPHVFETDKAWDALHRCLSDGTLEVDGGDEPLNLCFFGGAVLNEDADYFVVLLTPTEVSRVAAALAGVTETWLRERYRSLDFEGYQGEKSDDDWAYAWANFQGLPGFFSRAAAGGRHVIFTVDQ